MKKENSPMTTPTSARSAKLENGSARLTLAERKLRLDRERLMLFRNGYLPLPIYSVGEAVKRAGKRPASHIWPHWREPVPDEETIRRWTQHASWWSGENTGLLCGKIVGVDIDVPDEKIATEIQTLANAHFGPGALVRVGNAPKLLLVYRCDAPFRKIMTPKLVLPNGQEAQVEILADGQTFVALGIHPDTGRPYEWKGPSPIDTPQSSLPVVTEKQAREFVAEATLRLYKNGASNPRAAEHSKSTPNGTDPDDNSISTPTPFTRVNSLALKQLDKWAPVLFPAGHFETGTGAFRVPSSELNRALEEDLSIHPEHGGRDFGEEESCSPIDIVMKFGPDAGVIPPEKDEKKLIVSAFLWLCAQLGVEPASAGWTDLAGVAGPAEIDALVTEINRKHFVTQEGGKTFVVTEFRENSQRRLVWAQRRDFENLHAHDKITVVAKGRQPHARSKANVWFEHPNRRTFDRVDFDPSGKSRPGVYNLWTGFAVEPQRGNWDKFQQHIFNVICSGDPDAFEYLINWLARMVQRPEQLGEVAIVMRGGEGTGKGIFARTVGKLFGQHGLHISQPEQLVGKFNEHCRELVFLFADEAFYAGDIRHINVLKAIITEPTLMIEPKGLRAFPAKNHLHLFMASNNDWVIPASLDARRFCVLDVNTSKAGNRGWFDAINQQMEHDGGLAAMLYDLKRRDIGGFNVRDVPQTDALNDQKIASLPLDLKWWLDALKQECVLPTKYGYPGELNRWHATVSTDLLLESLNRFASIRRRAFSREQLGRTMRKVGYGDADQIRMPTNSLIGENTHGPIYSDERPRGYRLGTLDNARSRFCATTNLRICWIN
jgi:hypothetical protein